MKSQSKQDLATIFTQIEVGANQLDDVASRILTAIKEAKADTLDKFNELTWRAYDAKGWSRRIGAPVAGDVPAPSAVKVYVSTIRAAYRLGVKLLDLSAISEVRKAVKAARTGLAASTPKADPVPELKGVHLDKANKLTGNLWHDAIFLWENLPDSQQKALEDKVRKLVEQYTRKAPPALRIAA